MRSPRVSEMWICDVVIPQINGYIESSGSRVVSCLCSANIKRRIMEKPKDPKKQHALPDIFSYLDYRLYLREVCAVKKEQNPHFSYRYLSEKVQIKSAGFIYCRESATSPNGSRSNSHGSSSSRLRKQPISKILSLLIRRQPTRSAGMHLTSFSPCGGGV
jgi:hypothetical protein